jgi:hypothetical protein
LIGWREEEEEEEEEEETTLFAAAFRRRPPLRARPAPAPTLFSIFLIREITSCRC